LDYRNLCGNYFTGLNILFLEGCKVGTLPNIAILVAILISYSSLKFTTQVEKERKEILKKSLSDKPPVFSESEIELLPFPVKKWLSFLWRDRSTQGE